VYNGRATPCCAIQACRISTAAQVVSSAENLASVVLVAFRWCATERANHDIALGRGNWTFVGATRWLAGVLAVGLGSAAEIDGRSRRDAQKRSRASHV
jgi:hypothetical protein